MEHLSQRGMMRSTGADAPVCGGNLQLLAYHSCLASENRLRNSDTIEDMKDTISREVVSRIHVTGSVRDCVTEKVAVARERRYPGVDWSQDP